MNKPKKQGTQFETWLCKELSTYPGIVAERLAEGGSHDVGDIRVTTHSVGTWIVEAKARANLNVHQTLAAARHKAGHDPAVVIWKKLVRKDGSQRRVTDGEPIVVAMTLDDFIGFINWT